MGGKNDDQFPDKLQEKQNIAAAVKFLKKDEVLIGEVLTDGQFAEITRALHTITQGTLPEVELEQLVREVAFAMLDRKAFTQAANNFRHKLNTILKIIKRGSWETPAGYFEQVNRKAVTKRDSAKQGLQAEVKASYDMIAHCSSMLERAKGIIDPAVRVNAMAGFEESIALEREKLKQLSEQLTTFDSDLDQREEGTC